MNPVIVIPVLALIIAAIGITSSMSIQIQNESMDTIINVSESQNQRVREDVRFTMDADDNFTIENKWSGDTKIMEIRILDENGRVIKSWATDQDISPGISKQIILNDEIKEYLKSDP